MEEVASTHLLVSVHIFKVPYRSCLTDKYKIEALNALTTFKDIKPAIIKVILTYFQLYGIFLTFWHP